MAKSKNVAVPSRSGGYESVSIRPIDNGFIISRSTDKGYSECYSPTKPKIELPKGPEPKKADKPAHSVTALRLAAGAGKRN